MEPAGNAIPGLVPEERKQVPQGGGRSLFASRFPVNTEGGRQNRQFREVNLRGFPSLPHSGEANIPHARPRPSSIPAIEWTHEYVPQPIAISHASASRGAELLEHSPHTAIGHFP